VNLVLGVVPMPNSNRHLLPPSGWRLRLAVTMANSDATYWNADVSFESTVSQGIASLTNLKATIASD
jgi:hypothetical protein